MNRSWVIFIVKNAQLYHVHAGLGVLMLARHPLKSRTIFFDIYPSYFRLPAPWLDSVVGLAPLGPA